MDAKTYRDMHLLNELTQTPATTQRELSKRIGVALGLTNLMLRRLVTKGYVKITGAKRNRIRYLITPQGILEKTRLTYEFIEYSLQLYSGVRRFLQGQLVALAQTGQRRVLLVGTGELAEIAFLAVREIGLELVGIVELEPACDQFLGYPVGRLNDVPETSYDRVILCSLPGGGTGVSALLALGVSVERIILLPVPGMVATWPQGPAVIGAEASGARKLPEAASSAEPVNVG